MFLVLQVITEGREAQIEAAKNPGWASLFHLAESQGWAKVVRQEDKTCLLVLTEEGQKALTNPEVAKRRQESIFEAAFRISQRNAK